MRVWRVFFKCACVTYLIRLISTLWCVFLVLDCLYASSSGSREGDRGVHGLPPRLCKIKSLKNGFHVSRPPSYPANGSATEASVTWRRLREALLTFLFGRPDDYRLHRPVSAARLRLLCRLPFRFEFSRDTQSWQCWQLCTTSDTIS